MPLTYGGLLRQVEDTVRSLNNLGAGRNDRVAIVLPNGPEMAAAFLGVAAGATAAPLNPAYRQSEFDFYPGDCKARTLVVQAGDGLPAYKYEIE
jgi:acyl-CoA synthetase (AMP-forming)/AMP-acid ligase II